MKKIKRLLSDLLWERGFHHHTMLSFSKPHLRKGENRGKLSEDQEVAYYGEVIGAYDKDTDEFKEV